MENLYVIDICYYNIVVFSLQPVSLLGKNNLSRNVQLVHRRITKYRTFFKSNMKVSQDIVHFLLAFICFNQAISNSITSQSSSLKPSSIFHISPSSTIHSAMSSNSSPDCRSYSYYGYQSPIVVPYSQINNNNNSSSCWENLRSPDHCRSYNATQRSIKTGVCSDISSRLLYSEAPLFCCNFYGLVSLK